MTTHQAFIEFARLASDRLAGLLTVSINEEADLTPPYFYLHTGSTRVRNFQASIIVAGRLVVGREQLTATTWRDLADTAEYYKSEISRRLLSDGAVMFEKIDRRNGNVSNGHFIIRETGISPDLSQVDNLSEFVFTFELQTLNL